MGGPTVVITSLTPPTTCESGARGLPWSGMDRLEIIRRESERFAQVHRSVIVNLHRVSQVTRGLNETAELHLAGRAEVLPVSRNFLHLFRQM